MKTKMNCLLPVIWRKFKFLIKTPRMSTFSLECVENERGLLLLQPQMHITLLVPSEDSMAAIWVVFGHGGNTKERKVASGYRGSNPGP